MTTPESVALILRAKAGDPAAREEICRKYYPAWLRRVHGTLGPDLRVACSTEDIVQSAVADALRDLDELRQEAAFFSWVAAIARRKIAEKRRRLRRSPPAGPAARPEPESREAEPGEQVASESEYVRMLDAFIALFPAYPEHMGLLYLRYFEQVEVAGLTALFGRGKSTVYELLDTARALLRSRLGPRSP